MYGTDWNCATIIQLTYEKYFSNILDRMHTQWKERYPSLFSLRLNLFQDKIKNKNTVKYWWIILSKGSKKSNPFTRHFKIDSCQFFSSWDGFLLTVDNKTTVIGRSFIDTWSRECFELIVVFYYLNLFIFICNRIRRYIKYGNKLDFPFLFLFFCCFFINYTVCWNTHTGVKTFIQKIFILFKAPYFFFQNLQLLLLQSCFVSPFNIPVPLWKTGEKLRSLFTNSIKFPVELTIRNRGLQQGKGNVVQ